MKVGSLFAEIGFKVDKSGLDNFTKALQTFQKTVKAGLKDLKEYARAAREISQAMRDAYMPTEKERQQRFRAQTRYINASARKTNASAKYEKAVIRQISARALLDEIRAKFYAQDSNTRASNARSRERQTDLKERGLIGTHTGRYSAGIIQILRAIFGAQIGGIAGGIAGLAGAAHPIVAAIAISTKAIIMTLNAIMKTIRDGVRTAMGYRDYMAFTGRSTKGIAGLMAAALNTTNMTPEDIMKDVASLDKNFWDMFFGGGNPRAWQMMGILPTGNGETDLKNILASVWGATGGLQNRGLARSLLGQFGLSEEYITLLEDLKKNNPNEEMIELFSQFRERLEEEEQMNKNIREWDRSWKELRLQLASMFINIGFGDLFKKLVDLLEELVVWLKGKRDTVNNIRAGVGVAADAAKVIANTPIITRNGILESILDTLFERVEMPVNRNDSSVINQNNNFYGYSAEEAGRVSSNQAMTFREHGENEVTIAYENADSYA